MESRRDGPGDGVDDERTAHRKAAEQVVKPVRQQDQIADRPVISGWLVAVVPMQNCSRTKEARKPPARAT